MTQQSMARVLAARALGKPLPKRAEVHHVNGNPRDNRPANLVICEDKAYHRLLHQRARARGWRRSIDTGDFILRDIDPDLWRKVKSKAALEGETVKHVILKLLAKWVS